MLLSKVYSVSKDIRDVTDHLVGLAGGCEPSTSCTYLRVSFSFCGVCIRGGASMKITPDLSP